MNRFRNMTLILALLLVTLLVLAGISGCLIYFPALYFMMFDYADRLRTKKLLGLIREKLRRA